MASVRSDVAAVVAPRSARPADPVVTALDERVDGSPNTRAAGVIAVLSASAFWSFGGVLGKATEASGIVLSFWRMLAWAQPRVDASVTSVLIQLEPVGSSIAARVFLGERVSFLQGVAMAGVVAALCVLAYSESLERHVVLDEGLG